MKSLMSVFVVLPTLLATVAVCRAQTAGVPRFKPALSRTGGYPCDDRHPVEPLNAGADRMPYGPDVPCPDFPGPTNPGPEPLPYPKPHPRPWIEDDAARNGFRLDIERSAAVLNGAKSADHAAVLAALFDGSSPSVGESSLVMVGNPPPPADSGVAGDIKVPKTGAVLSRFVPAIERSGRTPSRVPRLIPVGAEEAIGLGVGIIVDRVITEASKAIDRAGDAIEREGERRAAEGKQAQKDAEEKYKNK